VARWRRALNESDAVLIASPEYGFSLPGALKNAIDWVIGSGELERKVVAITAATTSLERGRRGLQALRETLSAVRATIVGGEPIPNGAALESQVAALMQALIETAATVHPG
jgi:chromate reductase